MADQHAETVADEGGVTCEYDHVPHPFETCQYDHQNNDLGEWHECDCGPVGGGWPHPASAHIDGRDDG